MQRLIAGGVSPLGAAALVSRWANVESSTDGPNSVNPTTGAFGVGQWLGARKMGIAGDTNIDDQVDHALAELHGKEAASLYILNHAGNAYDAARGASAFERAEGWNAFNSTDNFTDATAKGIGDIAPLGSDAASSRGDVSISQSTTISVQGGADPKTTGDHVLNGQAAVNADLVRNAGATVR